MENLTASPPATINILAVIDTDYCKNYQTGSRSLDPSKPQAVNTSVLCEFLLCTGSRAPIQNQGTAKLSFTAYVGDHVKFRGTSIYQNSSDAVIIYSIKSTNAVEVFNKFGTNMDELPGAVQPNPDGDRTGIPPLKVPQNFLSLDSEVRKSGTETFDVYFALYELDDHNQNQVLVGYYKWDPSITVL